MARARLRHRYLVERVLVGSAAAGGELRRLLFGVGVPQRLTRSTVASAFGVLLFWMLCWLVDYCHLRMLAQPGGSLSPLSQFLMDAGYWVLPKPLDLSGIFFDAMNAETLSAKPEELKIAESGGQYHPELSVATSLAFAAGVLGLSAFEFKMTDN